MCEHGCTHEMQSLQYLIKQLVREGRLVESDCEWSTPMNGWLIDPKTYRTIFNLYHQYQKTALLNAPAWPRVSDIASNASATVGGRCTSILTKEPTTTTTNSVKYDAEVESTPPPPLVRRPPRATVGTQTMNVSVHHDSNQHRQTQTPITITLTPGEQRKRYLYAATAVRPSTSAYPEKKKQYNSVQIEKDVVFSPLIEREEIVNTIVDHHGLTNLRQSEGQSIRQKTEEAQSEIPKEENEIVAIASSSHASTYSGYDTFQRLHQRFGIGSGEIP